MKILTIALAIALSTACGADVDFPGDAGVDASTPQMLVQLGQPLDGVPVQGPYQELWTAGPVFSDFYPDIYGAGDELLVRCETVAMLTQGRGVSFEVMDDSDC